MIVKTTDPVFVQNFEKKSFLKDGREIEWYRCTCISSEVFFPSIYVDDFETLSAFEGSPAYATFFVSINPETKRIKLRLIALKEV